MFQVQNALQWRSFNFFILKIKLWHVSWNIYMFDASDAGVDLFLALGECKLKPNLLCFKAESKHSSWTQITIRIYWNKRLKKKHLHVYMLTTICHLSYSREKR